MNADRFVGTWRLVSMEFRSEDGEVTYPFGQDARGYIAYAADGYMNVALARSGRPTFQGGDMLGGSILEQATAAAGYLSYAGRYEVRESTVVHCPDVSLFPNWEGGEQERMYEFQGNRLMLSAAPDLMAGKLRSAHLIWERVRQDSAN